MNMVILETCPKQTIFSKCSPGQTALLETFFSKFCVEPRSKKNTYLSYESKSNLKTPNVVPWPECWPELTHIHLLSCWINLDIWTWDKNPFLPGQGTRPEKKRNVHTDYKIHIQMYMHIHTWTFFGVREMLFFAFLLRMALNYNQQTIIFFCSSAWSS